jgi:F0F1-type ATP synthase membrane subunit c/vacuolar-type H+-ATPase subunit K
MLYLIAHSYLDGELGKLTQESLCESPFLNRLLFSFFIVGLPVNETQILFGAVIF